MPIKWSDFMRAPIVGISDSMKRKRMAAELEALQDGRRNHVDGPGIQFENIDLQNLTPENSTWLLVLEDILRRRRDFSLMQWSGGPALVFTRDIDKLTDTAARNVTEDKKFIIRGGSAGANQLAKMKPLESKTITGDLG